MKVKKILVLFCSLLMVLAMMAFDSKTASAAENSTKKFTLKLNTYGANNTADDKLLEDWTKIVEKRSNGRLKIDIYWSQALGKITDLFQQLDTNLCDLGFAGYIFFPGKFPITDVIGLPYLVTNSASTAVLLNGMLADGLLKEWDIGVKIIAFLPTDPTLMFFRDKKVTSMEELKGMKIRAPGKANLDIVEALGAIPTAISTTDLYMSLDRGIIDGLCTSLGYYYPSKLYEVTKYALLEPMGAGMNFVVMSKSAWDKLPADLQLIIEETSSEYFIRNINMQIDQYVNKAIPGIKKEGIEVYQLSQSEKIKWDKATEKLVKNWIKAKEDSGLPGAEAVRRAMSLKEATQ